MYGAAIIIAERSEQRRTIAACLSPLELFDELHFSTSLKELKLLLKHLSPRFIFAAADSGEEKETLRSFAALANLAHTHHCPLAFFSMHDPEELLRSGTLPPHCHCYRFRMEQPELRHTLLSIITSRSPGTSNPQRQYLPEQKPQELCSRFSFEKFLRHEKSRSRLTGRPFSLLLIRSEPASSAPDATRPATLLPSLALTIKPLVRNSDLLCRLDECRLALLMPETSHLHARLVCDRIRSHIGRLSNPPGVNLSFDLSPSPPPAEAPAAADRQQP